MGEHRNWYPSHPVVGWGEYNDTKKHIFKEEKVVPPFKVGVPTISAFSMTIDAPGSSTANYTASATQSDGTNNEKKCGDFGTILSLARASTTKKCEWSNNKQHTLLNIYKKYKIYRGEFLCPDVKEETVWRKIAEEVRERTSLNCDESDCRNKIDDLKREYERLKNSPIKSFKVKKYLAHLRTLFETTENPGEYNDTKKHIFKEKKVVPPFKIGVPTVSAFSMTIDAPGSSTANYTASATQSDGTNDEKKCGDFGTIISLASASTTKKCEWSNNKQRTLLNIYKKYKICRGEFSCPDVNEETVWRKIAEEVRERTSLNCDESDCRNKIDDLKCEYERLKNSPIKSFKVEKYLAHSRMLFETTENPVTSNAQMSTEKCGWRKAEKNKLLEVYAKHKAKFSRPGVNEQTVWQEIVKEVRKKTSLHCDELECRNKIDDMKCEYERLKNSPLTNWKTANYLDRTRKFFETNENPVFSNVQMLIQNRGWTKTKERMLLNVYAKYKAALSSPDVNEQSVWRKIVEEVNEKTSLNCDESDCRNKIDDLKREYESLKNSPSINRKQAKFFDYTRKYFETNENPVNFSVEQSHNVHLKECAKKNNSYLLQLLQVYTKYKTELNHLDVTEQEVWGKVAREMQEVYSYNCGEGVCRLDLLRMKQQYESIKNGLRTGNMPFYYDGARRAFEAGENLEKTFTLRVDNLSKRHTECNLQELFQCFGRIANIYMTKDTSGLFRGTAYITFYRQEDAQRAFSSVNGHIYDNLILRVRWLETWGYKTEKNRKRRMHSRNNYGCQKRGRQDQPNMLHNTLQNQNSGNDDSDDDDDDDDDDDISVNNASNQSTVLYEGVESVFPSHVPVQKNSSHFHFRKQ